MVIFLASDADVFGLVNINSLNAILGCYLLVNDQWKWCKPECDQYVRETTKKFYWDSGLKRKGQQSLMGWGLLQRNLQEGIWGAIRIKNAHPFGTDTLIRVYFAFHGHIFRICECMSCRWFLAQSSSKATGGTKLSAKPA